MDAMYPKQTAATIRRILRKTFPATKFSVTTGRGSGVSSVDVDWTDGPTAARVEEIVAGFEAGRFDGMTDSYDYDRSRFLLVDGKPFRPACRYVFCHQPTSAKPAMCTRFNSLPRAAGSA